MGIRMVTAFLLAVMAGLSAADARAQGMVLVPAGEFQMGNPFSAGELDELPVHPVLLDAYFIDSLEVTNQQYAAGLNWAWAQGGLITVAGGVVYRNGGSELYCDTTGSSPSSRITWDVNTFGVVSGKEQHPMVEVSWYGAVAFCNWRSAMSGKPLCYDLSTWDCDFGAGGFRLPTEAEWEKAAGWDPVAGRHFRFGEHTDGCGYNCLDGQRANQGDSGNPFQTGAYPFTTPVSFYDGTLHHKSDFGWPGAATSYQTQDARSFYGCRDMSGNVWEWCYDWWDAGYYRVSPYENPTGPLAGTYRVFRGGGWYAGPSLCRSACRGLSSPGFRLYLYGFRCAVTAPPHAVPGVSESWLVSLVALILAAGAAFIAKGRVGPAGC